MTDTDNEFDDIDGVTTVEDIEDDDGPGVALDREADAILLADRAGPRPLRRAVREDASLVREWGRTRAERLRGAVQDEPLKASLYALGAGVLIGLLAAR
jgi:hypothetical protein